MHAHLSQSGAASFGFHDYLDAVAHLPTQDARPLSLRLHFPFDASGEALATYLIYLKRESAMHAVLLTGMSTVRQLGFDGPAAARLDERALAGLSAHLHDHFRFMPDHAGDYEVTLALAELAAGRLRRLRQQGFNRLRIELDAAGEDAALLRAAADMARDAGFRSVGVALGYGMPDQGFAAFRGMLETALAAVPDLVLLRHQPGAGRDVADIPAGGVAQRMQQLGSDRLDMAGYTCVGPDRFALLPGCPGAFARTHRTPAAAQPQLPGTHLVGCGLAARGDFGALRWQNVAPLNDYYARLDSNQVPVAQGGWIAPAIHAAQTQPYLMQVKDFQDTDQ